MVKAEGVYNVSIHAPLARSNIKPLPDAFRIAVSIHAPLARSNNGEMSQDSPRNAFQYMLLLRGAT